MFAPHPPATQGDPPDIAASKAALRKHCAAALRARDVTRDSAIADRLMQLLQPRPGQIIAGVWPLPDEVDLRPLCHRLHAAGAVLVLPETPPRGNPLIFRRWSPDCTMLPGRFGTQHPEGDCLTPQTVLVPLLGFDRAGNRLGYGGGYYDRTLATLPDAARIGYAPSTQEVESLPAGPHDQPLSCIVTEKETLRFD